MAHYNTVRIELDVIEIIVGVFVCAEVEISYDFIEGCRVEGYVGDEYVVDDVETELLFEGSHIDSDIYLIDSNDEETEISYDDDKALFAMAEPHIIEWLISSREGRQMVEDAIEEDCASQAEQWAEMAYEPRY